MLTTHTQLSRAVWDLRGECRFGLQDLYQKFTDQISKLPLAAFATFLAGHDSPLEAERVLAIIRILLPPLLPSNSPPTWKVDPEADANEAVSPAILQQCYLPFAYRTADNNARISIAVETLLRIMWGADGIAWTPGFHEAIVKGIKARNKKSAPKKGKKEDGDPAAREVLRASASRLMVMCEILKAQAQQEEALS